MVQFEELMLALQALKPEIDDLSDALGMKAMRNEIEQLELRATEPGFWDNVEKSQEVLQKTGALKGKVEAYEALVAKYEDAAALIELANEEEDLSLLEEAQSEVDGVRERSRRSTTSTATKPDSKAPFCSSKARTPTATSKARQVFTVWCAYLLSILPADDTPAFLRWRSCPKWTTT